MITQLLISLRALVVLTLVTSGIYPLLITGIAQSLFPTQANGSIVYKDGRAAGSVLLAQKFTDAGYFHPRPSASDYGTVPSGGSNRGFTSRELLDAVAGRRAAWGDGAPADLLYASASGLDPHLSPEGAHFQIARVAQARGIPPDVVSGLVQRYTEGPQLGFLGQPRVNVLALNLALDGNGAPSMVFIDKNE